jgi:hypothetical protein
VSSDCRMLQVTMKGYETKSKNCGHAVTSLIRSMLKRTDPQGRSKFEGSICIAHK